MRIGPTVCVLAAAIACGGDSPIPFTQAPSPAPVVAQTPSITVIKSFASTILQGRGSGYGMAIKRGGGFTGAVELSLEGLPPGITGTLRPGNAIPAGTSNFSIDISVPPSATPGLYPIVVRAHALGVADSTATLAITIASAPFLITAPVTAITLPQGGGMQFSVALSRDGNFTGPVTISLEGGVTNVVSVPASITTTGTVATFGIRAASNADGAGTILVRATTGEVETEQARNVVVTVVPTPAGVGNVTHRFCDEKPVWLAASDGNGPWRRIPEASPGVFTYSVGARGSMAYVTTTATSNTLHVFQLNAAELKALANRTCALTHDSVTVPFSGLTTGEYVSTTIGADGVTTTATSSHATVTFKPVVSADSSDLVAYTVTPAGMFNRLVTKRALVLRAGLVLPVVDFDGADVVPFVSAMLNLALPPALSGALSVTTSLTTASSRTTAQLDTKLLASGVTSTATPSFVAGTLKGGDVVERHISSAPGNSAIDTFQAYYYDAGGITPSFVVPSFSRNWTLLTTPSAMYGRVGIRVPAEAGWDQTLQFVGQHADGSRRVELLTSALYDPDMSITTPDFSNTDGWNDAWGPRVGVALDVTLTRGGGVGRTGTLFDVVSGRSWLALAQRNISIVP